MCDCTLSCTYVQQLKLCNLNMYNKNTKKYILKLSYYVTVSSLIAQKDNILNKLQQEPTYR